MYQRLFPINVGSNAKELPFDRSRICLWARNLTLRGAVLHKVFTTRQKARRIFVGYDYPLDSLSTAIASAQTPLGQRVRVEWFFV